MESFHTPALQIEAVDALQVTPGAKFIDATLGGAGHTVEILKRGGRVLGIDLDPEAIEEAKIKIAQAGKEIGKDAILMHGNFKDIEEIARSNGFDKASGILFDLGVSSHQLERTDRGFSFQKDAILDMRMDPTGLNGTVTAKDLINGLTKKELYELFTKLGQEKFALAISDSITRAREIRPIEKTSELAQLITRVYRKRGVIGGIHPATRAFMALRIAVNDEFYNIKSGLPGALNALEKRGRLVVISFHSLEDGIVKRAFKEFEAEGLGTVLTKKVERPTSSEIKTNIRARTAKMRIFEKANL